MENMGRGTVWPGTGTHESLLEASSPEETAYRQGYISREQLEVLIEPLKKNAYGQYLQRVIDERVF